jgi:hypothetical protein
MSPYQKDGKSIEVFAKEEVRKAISDQGSEEESMHSDKVPGDRKSTEGKKIANNHTKPITEQMRHKVKTQKRDEQHTATETTI